MLPLSPTLETQEPPVTATIEPLRLLNAQEVGDMLRVSKKSTYILIEKEIIPPTCVIRIGKRVRVRHDALLAWINTDCQSR